jgi:inorganic triphosphatase YgiF
VNLIERELKLVPAEPVLLDQLASVSALGPFQVVGRRRERQRNSFFDTRQRSLRSAHLALRRRTVEGQPLASWTLKAAGTLVGGVLSRPEIELQLQPDMPPALALSALGQSARERGAAALAEQLEDALADAGGSWPLAQPYLEFDTDRRVLDLRAEPAGWEVELALDTLRLSGHTYTELEIEIELRRGDESALEAARQAISELGAVAASAGTKLSRTLDHLAACQCGSGLRA